MPPEREKALRFKLLLCAVSNVENDNRIILNGKYDAKYVTVPAGELFPGEKRGRSGGEKGTERIA